MEKILNTNHSRGITNIIGIFLITIFTGEYNLLGFLYPYYLAYFRRFNNELLMSDLTWIPIVWIIFTAVGSPLCVKISNKFGYRQTFLLYVVFNSVIHFSCQYISSFKLFVLLYA